MERIVFAGLEWIGVRMKLNLRRGCTASFPRRELRRILPLRIAAELFRSTVEPGHAGTEVGLRVNQEVAVEHNLVAEREATGNRIQIL